MAVEDRYEQLRLAYEAIEVGYRVRIIRATWEMSQSAMARHLNTRPNTISQIESGLSRPATDIEIRMKAAFGITTDWLRFGEMSGLSPDLIVRLEDAKATLGPQCGKTAAKRAAVKKPRKFSRPARKVEKKS